MVLVLPTILSPLSLRLLQTSRPESGKWETPIRQEPGNWEKTAGRTVGLQGWSGMSGNIAPEV